MPNYNNSAFLTTCLASMTFVSGCAQLASDARPPTSIESENVVYRTQTSIGSCAPTKENLIVAAVLSSAVSYGITQIGEIMKAASQTETVTDSSRQNIQMSQAGKFGPCITVIRGWFYRDPPPLSTSKSAAFSVNPDALWEHGKGVIGTFWQNGMAIAATPDFFFQGYIFPSADKTMYAVQPLAARLEKPLVASVLRPGGERHVTLSFAFDNKIVDLSKSPGATIVLGKLSPQRRVSYAEQPCIYSDFTDEKDKEEQKISDPLNCEKANTKIIYNSETSNWFSVVLDPTLKPFHIQTLITETRGSQEFMKLLSGIFADPSVRKAVMDKVL